ncbi:MAG: hypothetical protein REH83_06800 [Rickettsiella sp.]|nr:hypothetical protein [Rickettsiella sp.]
MSSKKIDTSKAKSNEKLIIKSMLIRAPETYFKDLKKIASLSGLSVNAVCLELLRVGIKQRLKE